MMRTEASLEAETLFYEAALDPSLWPQALQKLAEAVGCVGTAMIAITPNDTSGLVVSPALDEANREYQREWWQVDTRVGRIFSRRLSSGVVCEAQLFTDDEIARDPLRQEFLAAHKLGAFAAQLVEPWPRHVVAFSVQRAAKNGHFAAAELEDLRRLGRHAARALTLGARLAASEALSTGLLGLLDRFGGGVIVLNARREVTFMNPCAARLAGDGLTLTGRRLHASLPDRQPALDRLIASAFEAPGLEAPQGPLALPRPSGGRPLFVQAMPLPGRAVRPDDGTIKADRQGALLLVVDPDDAPGAPVDALRLLGLTPAEARLAVLVGGGLRRRDAAALIGVSEWTARDTLKVIYSKLGVSTQGALVRLVDRLSALAPPCHR